jgi:transposase
MDMSPSFISGVMEHLLGSQMVFDKFHPVHSLNKALDEVRLAERKGNDLLKGHKYTVWRKYGNLSGQKKSELDYVLMMYPKLGKAYRLRELFLDVFSVPDPEEAKGYLCFRCDMAMEAKISPYGRFVNTIKSHWSGITAYFEKRVINGVLEGINNKMQLAKRRARGYRNTTNYLNMVYFLTAKLKFDYPLYST